MKPIRRNSKKKLKILRGSRTLLELMFGKFEDNIACYQVFREFGTKQ